MADEIDEGIEVLKEVEIAWLSEKLSTSIANLPYPVGCGVPPDPERIKKAAETLFGRYARMIEMARRAREH